MDSASSFGSQYSLYSIEGGKGNYDITGEVLFGVTHKDGLLTVNVERAKGLAATDKGGFSNPYIKTYLLPDKSKHSKKKTGVKHKTTDPYYGEVLKVMVQLFFIIYFSLDPLHMQYKLSQSEVPHRTLWLSVWDFDRFGKNQFLGEVQLPLSSVDLNDPTPHWHTLQDKVCCCTQDKITSDLSSADVG